MKDIGVYKVKYKIKYICIYITYMHMHTFYERATPDVDCCR